MTLHSVQKAPPEPTVKPEAQRVHTLASPHWVQLGTLHSMQAVPVGPTRKPTWQDVQMVALQVAQRGSIVEQVWVEARVASNRKLAARKTAFLPNISK